MGLLDLRCNAKAVVRSFRPAVGQRSKVAARLRAIDDPLL